MGAFQALRKILGLRPSTLSREGSREVNMGLLKQLSDEINQIIESVMPSIVEIQGYQKRASLNPMRILEGKHKEFGTMGAGVVIDSKGFIVTNHHVVEGWDRITVGTSDKRKFEGDVCGVDPTADVAVLHIPCEGLPPAQVESNRKASVGEIVFAVGHPLGLSSSVTMGIISAAARLEFGPQSNDRPLHYLQTDAAISGGNSGGALVDYDGKVLGINTLGVDPEEGQGLAFAIPMSSVLKVAEKLMKGEKVSYGTIGVSGLECDLPAEIARAHSLKQTTAILVDDIQADSPAEKVGLELDDWILTINGQAIESLVFFLEKMDEQIGKTVTLRLIRGDGSLAEKRVKVEKLEIET